jgi:hypothetical protein
VDKQTVYKQPAVSVGVWGVERFSFFCKGIFRELRYNLKKNMQIKYTLDLTVEITNIE